MENSKAPIDKLLDIMKRLRRECPWDAKQTHESLKPYLLEEAYEVLETIDEREWDKLASELGDLLLQVVFHSQLGSEEGRFDFNDVADRITKKLIERHPHVFGDKSVHSAEEVQNNWEHTKHTAEKRSSILAGIPKFMPALLQAQRLQEKAATVGFEWDNIEQVIDKIEEELQEFKDAYRNNNHSELSDEFGDLLFSLVNLSRYLHINSEDSLRKTNNKFIRRFNYIENQYNNSPAAMKEASLEELDSYWNEAKTAAAGSEHERLIGQLLHDTQSLLNLVKLSENNISGELKERIAYQEKANKELLFYLREPELDLAEIPVKDFITSSLELIGIRTDEIKMDIRGEIGALKIDAELFSRAFNAIISNALSAVSGDISKIKITVSPASEFALQEKFTHIEFKITDEGTGISNDFMQLIFEPFFTTRKNEGAAGFGLSNAKKIIEKHGGTIKIESQKGKGTEVRFTIPVKH